jgi:chitosanase
VVRRLFSVKGLVASAAVTSVILLAAAGPVSDIIFTRRAAEEIAKQNTKFRKYGQNKKYNTGWYVPDQLADISVEPTGGAELSPKQDGWDESPQDADSASVIVPAETAPQVPQAVAAQDDDTSLSVDQLSYVNPTTSNQATPIPSDGQNDPAGTPIATPTQPVDTPTQPESEPSQPLQPSQPKLPVAPDDPEPAQAPADDHPDTQIDSAPKPAEPADTIIDQPEPSPTVTVANPKLPTGVDVTAPDLPGILIPEVKPTDLTDPAKKDIAMQLVSSAENSSLDWKGQYGYIEDIGDGRGYTAGIIGFCSGTHDMLELVQYYTKIKPNNALAQYLPALQKVDGTDSHAGLGAAYELAWKAAATDPLFQKAQNDERDRVYFSPAVAQAKADGLQALGQFIYYDAMVMHGPGDDSESFGGIRKAALNKAKTPAQGGDETAYLNAFLDARSAVMKMESAHEDTSRIDTAQRKFLQAGNLTLKTPLSWSVYGDPFKIQ